MKVLNVEIHDVEQEVFFVFDKIEESKVAELQVAYLLDKNNAVVVAKLVSIFREMNDLSYELCTDGEIIDTIVQDIELGEYVYPYGEGD